MPIFSLRWTWSSTRASIRPSILSFLRLAFLVTSPPPPRYVFRVTLSPRAHTSFVHSSLFRLCPMCVSACVSACVCRWTINRSRSIAFADSGKIGIPSGNTMHKEAYRFEGKTGCAAARYRFYTIVPRFYPSGKPSNGREVRSVDYPIPSLSPNVRERICDN